MIELKTIESWSEITIGQYQEMMSIQTESDLTRFIEAIAILQDCDPQDIRNLPYKEYKVLQDKFNFIKKEPESEVVYRFELKGKRYGLMRDMNLMTAGVFIDAEEFKKDPIKNLHMTVALIYRPIVSEDGDDYEIEPHKAEGFERRALLFKRELSIQMVMGAVLFFSLLAMELSINSLESFQKEMQKELKMKTTPTRMQRRKANRSKKTGGSIT